MDCVIPSHKKDYEVLPHCIESVREFLDVRNIVVISAERPSNLPDGVIWHDQDTLFPFTSLDIAGLLKAEYVEQAGWYHQQLIKLYAGLFLKGLTPRYMVIDSDTIVMRSFRLETDGMPVFSSSDEYHVPYFEAMARMHKDLRKVMDRSAIAHYMVLDKTVCQQLFRYVEKYHGDSSPFWRLFVQLSSDHRNGQSEYEMYFSFYKGVLHKDCLIESLKFENRQEFSRWRSFRGGPNAYVSFHAYHGRT